MPASCLSRFFVFLALGSSLALEQVQAQTGPLPGDPIYFEYWYWHHADKTGSLRFNEHLLESLRKAPGYPPAEEQRLLRLIEADKQAIARTPADILSRIRTDRVALLESAIRNQKELLLKFPPEHYQYGYYRKQIANMEGELRELKGQPARPSNIKAGTGQPGEGSGTSGNSTAGQNPNPTKDAKPPTNTEQLTGEANASGQRPRNPKDGGTVEIEPPKSANAEAGGRSTAEGGSSGSGKGPSAANELEPPSGWGGRLMKWMETYPKTTAAGFALAQFALCAAMGGDYAECGKTASIDAGIAFGLVKLFGGQGALAAQGLYEWTLLNMEAAGMISEGAEAQAQREARALQQQLNQQRFGGDRAAQFRARIKELERLGDEIDKDWNVIREFLRNDSVESVRRRLGFLAASSAFFADAERQCVAAVNQRSGNNSRTVATRGAEPEATRRIEAARQSLLSCLTPSSVSSADQYMQEAGQQLSVLQLALAESRRVEAESAATGARNHSLTQTQLERLRPMFDDIRGISAKRSGDRTNAIAAYQRMSTKLTEFASLKSQLIAIANVVALPPASDPSFQTVLSMKVDVHVPGPSPAEVSDLRQKLDDQSRKERSELDQVLAQATALKSRFEAAVEACRVARTASDPLTELTARTARVEQSVKTARDGYPSLYAACRQKLACVESGQELAQADSLISQGAFDGASAIINKVAARSCDVSGARTRLAAAMRVQEELTSLVALARSSCNFAEALTFATRAATQYPSNPVIARNLATLRPWQSQQSSIQQALRQAAAESNADAARNLILSAAMSANGGPPCLQDYVSQQARLVSMKLEEQKPASQKPNTNTNTRTTNTGDQEPKEQYAASLHGECTGGISATRLSGYQGESTTIRVRITGLWRRSIERVVMTANGREVNPPATKLGDGLFERVARFIGRAEPLEVFFVALDGKNERRCAGSITLQNLGPK